MKGRILKHFLRMMKGAPAGGFAKTGKGRLKTPFPFSDGLFNARPNIRTACGLSCFRQPLGLR
ncbi:hypothetical protein BG910_11940 [Neisseria chenwenguii]|uniref:Uncharacterized protein n=1 Tax=Neisseria chenwenguii TaxID=1853278 RepID=A0A220S4T0_9NEIS|nr:hypothetical protein [Neisseria chenwenguii]ASK28353.1 hypothetical protein BG910_11940 [Neisseria chenwenguii]ROV55420.1 hypothetical protein EGS38_09465 [Neisseria chenwenguii]